jgi:MFS family permease
VPQIRFSGREVSSDAVVIRSEVSEPNVFRSNASSASFSASEGFPPSYPRVEGEPITSRAGGLDRQAAVRSALNAGAIAAVLCLLPLGFIVAMPMAGYFGVRLYRRRSMAPELPPGAGFKLGALSGLFGSVIFTAVKAVNTVAFSAQGEFRDAIIEAVRRAQARNPDPQARQMLEYFTSPHGMIAFLVLSAVLVCAAFVLLSGLGGAISASLFRKKRPQA